MANVHNVKSNRWAPFAAHLAEGRASYGKDELLLRIVSLMEMAYAEGKRDAFAVEIKKVRSSSAM